jgi:hypothetical protein
VSNAKKKRKRPSGSTSTYRAPAPAEPARKGLLDGLLAPRTPGASPMPKLRTTIAKGAMTALGIPGLLIAVPVVLLVAWLILTVFGFQGPFTALNVTFAIPPITTFADAQIAGRTFRAAVDASGLSATLPGFAGLAGLLLVHAALAAVIATLCVEQLRTGGTSTWALRRALRVLRTTAAVGLLGLGLLVAGNLVAAVFGSIGVILGLVGSMVVGVYLFGFAPAIAADEDRRVADVLIRSVRAARMPGSANLWFAIGYVLIGLVTVVAPLPGSEIGVTPTAMAWASSLLVNLFGVIVQAILVYRYLVIADEVPEQPPPRERAASRRA